MAIRQKVVLKDQDSSLSCPFTGWSISRKEEKMTPEGHSPRIVEWLRSGALIPVDPGIKYQELLSGDPSAMTHEAVIEIAKRINSSQKRTVIKWRDSSGTTLDRDEIASRINKWRSGLEDVTSDNEAIDGLGDEEAIDFINSITDIESLREFGRQEHSSAVADAIDVKIDQLEKEETNRIEEQAKKDAEKEAKKTSKKKDQ